VNTRYKIIAGDLFYRTIGDLIELIDGVEYLKHGESVFMVIKTKFIQDGMLWDSDKQELVSEIHVVDNFGKRIYS